MAELLEGLAKKVTEKFWFKLQIKKAASTLDTLEVSHDFVFKLRYRFDKMVETGLDAAAKPAVFEDNRS